MRCTRWIESTTLNPRKTLHFSLYRKLSGDKRPTLFCSFSIHAKKPSCNCFATWLLICGRGRRNRTLNLRFWRPSLCQLSYTPAKLGELYTIRRNFTKLFDDASHDTSAHRMATFTDSKTKTLFHSNRSNQRHRHLNVVARHHHVGAFR